MSWAKDDKTSNNPPRPPREGRPGVPECGDFPTTRRVQGLNTGREVGVFLSLGPPHSSNPVLQTCGPVSTLSKDGSDWGRRRVGTAPWGTTSVLPPTPNTPRQRVRGGRPSVVRNLVFPTDLSSEGRRLRISVPTRGHESATRLRRPSVLWVSIKHFRVSPTAGRLRRRRRRR